MLLLNAQKRFALDEIPSEPWRNGHGWTRILATQTAAGKVVWRISVADLESPGLFSRYQGMDRHAALISGHALSLHTRDSVVRFDGLGAVAQFSGEDVLHTDLVEGPARLLSVMVQRGKARAELFSTDKAVSCHSQGLVSLVLCVGGECSVEQQDGGGVAQLAPFDGLLLAPTAPAIQLIPDSPNARFIVAHVHPDESTQTNRS